MKFGWSFLENQESNLVPDELAKSFVRCFSSSDGKQVLNYLCDQIKNRFLPATSSTNELWFFEGKRALLAQIEHLINKGKKGE